MKISAHINIKPLNIDLDRIAVEYGPFSMSFNFELEKLIRSIGVNGIINTPLLFDEAGEKLTIISGFRRIKAAESMGMTHLECRVLTPDNITPQECLALNFFENISTRQFNDIEKAMAINRLSAHLKNDEVKDEYLPLLGISPSKRNLELYKKIDSDLRDEIRMQLAKGKIPIKVIREMLEMDNETREELFKIIIGFGLNNNQQRNLIDFTRDLASIKGISLRDVIGRVAGEDIGCEHANLPQRARSLMKKLKGLRYPKLSESEARFSRQIKRLEMPKEVRIGASPFFEEPYYHLEIMFKDGIELTRQLKVIYDAEGIENLGDPWLE